MLSPFLLRQRSSFLQAVRKFFLQRDYLEVDTPIRLPALIPEATLLPFPSAGHFLQTSPEICMKRLLASGNRRLFQLCHCFRREEEGRYHLPEFSMLEWYRSGWTYRQLMEECEEFVRRLATENSWAAVQENIPSLVFGRHRISLAPPWPRLTLEDAFGRYGGTSVAAALEQDCFDRLLVEKIEPHLGFDRPVFLMDYPVQRASLARCKADNPAVAERFELYIGGIEVANGFTELTDAAEQRRRFEREQELSRGQGNDFGPLPEKFLADLERLSPCAGIAMGLDRLFMLLIGAERVAEAVSFAPDDL